MNTIQTNTALIERLLNDFDLSPRARQFVLSLRSWEHNKGLTKNQIDALNYLEKSYLNTSRSPSEQWTQRWSEQKKKTAEICATYYAENPPYFNDLSHRILNDKSFIPTEMEFRKLTENKYAQKVLAEHYGTPMYSEATMVCLRTPSARKLDMMDLKEVPLMILKTHAAPIIRAASGAKRYLVLPINCDSPFLVEERDIKKYKINH